MSARNRNPMQKCVSLRIKEQIDLIDEKIRGNKLRAASILGALKNGLQRLTFVSSSCPFLARNPNLFSRLWLDSDPPFLFSLPVSEVTNNVNLLSTVLQFLSF